MKAPTLTTDRLSLREATFRDAEFLFQLMNSPGWIEFIGDRGIKSMADAENYISDRLIASYKLWGYGLYVVYQIENNIPVGLCGLVNRPTLPTVDLGFALLPVHEGKGYGTESAREVLRWAREELKLTPILAITHPENIRSQALLERLGMQFVEEKILEGGEEAVCIYEI